LFGSNWGSSVANELKDPREFRFGQFGQPTATTPVPVITTRVARSPKDPSVVRAVQFVQLSDKVPVGKSTANSPRIVASTGKEPRVVNTGQFVQLKVKLLLVSP